MGWTCEICGMVSKERASGRSLAVHQQFNSECVKLSEGKKPNKTPSKSKVIEVIEPDQELVVEDNYFCDSCENRLTTKHVEELEGCPFCGEVF